MGAIGVQYGAYVVLAFLVEAGGANAVTSALRPSQTPAPSNDQSLLAALARTRI